MLLYIERWLKAPVKMLDGALVECHKGTPQGGVVSPLLANLFLHYTFDAWMVRNCSSIPFERYADDIVAHCKTEQQAEWLKRALAQRMAECRLELHPVKTRVVYCQNDNQRQTTYLNKKFDFLGYTFCPRGAKDKFGRLFAGFIPAVSAKAARKIRDTIREWRLSRRVGSSLEEFARLVNPVIRGWIQYYGRFYKSALNPLFDHLNRVLGRWAMRKYKRFRRHKGRATNWLKSLSVREPNLFEHWSFGVRP